MQLRYFQPIEFERCSPSCSITEMDEDFLDLLDRARHVAGVPFHVNCAFRSVAYDLAKGRSGKSYHTRGRAVDVRAVEGSSRAKIVKACLAFGLSVGVYKTFLHIDNRENQIVFYGQS